jgi:transposase
MAHSTRFETERLDLAGFEAWLREQLAGTGCAAILVVVLQLVRALFEQNTQLRARLLGRRLKPPSERLCTVERQLFFSFALPNNDVTSAASKEPGPGQTPGQKDKEATSRRKPTSRQRLPRHIATVDVPNNLPADQRRCEDCQVPMIPIRPRVVETLEVIPARILIHRRLDKTIACPRCDAIRCAKAPPSILDGGLLGPVLVTEGLCDKILNGMPVERQARHFQRQGVPLSPSTLGRSISALLALLVPLAARITLRMKQSERVQLDSTGLRVQDAKAPTGIWRDTLWVLIGDRRWVCFAALRFEDSDSLEDLLEGAEADSFQCDGTALTNFVENKWRRCRPGCHAHVRRKLVEAVRRGDLRAMEPLRLYSQLFRIEREATRQGLDPAERQQRREAQSVPLLDRLREWVLAIAPSVEPKSPLGQALTYLQRQWMRLCLFVLDGEIEITNNRSERELRPWVLGQHAWLFVGDQTHAKRWAAGFSLVHTALAHGVNPRAYLHAVVAKLLAGHPHTRLDELLPDAMLRAHPELADPLRAGLQILRSEVSDAIAGSHAA